MTFHSNLASNGVGRGVIAGKFTTANGAAPTGVVGEGFTVARTAEGRWTVTITEAIMQVVAVLVGQARETLPTADANELIQCFVDQDTISVSGFEIQSYLTTDIEAADAAATLDDAPGDEIHFIAVVQFAGSTSD